MKQEDRLNYLIRYLLQEKEEYQEISVPTELADQKRLLRSLMNVRLPAPVHSEFLKIQDEYLQEEAAARGITRIETLSPVSEGIYLWQGDITTLNCDAIVNAANSQMLGCFIPNQNCMSRLSNKSKT